MCVIYPVTAPVTTDVATVAIKYQIKPISAILSPLNVIATII
jgi:hypothetical protein